MKRCEKNTVLFSLFLSFVLVACGTQEETGGIDSTEQSEEMVEPSLDTGAVEKWEEIEEIPVELRDELEAFELEFLAFQDEFGVLQPGDEGWEDGTIAVGWLQEHWYALYEYLLTSAKMVSPSWISGEVGAFVKASFDYADLYKRMSGCLGEIPSETTGEELAVTLTLIADLFAEELNETSLAYSETQLAVLDRLEEILR